MSEQVVQIATRIMVIIAIVISVVLLFVGIGVLILIHICIVGRAFQSAAAEIGCSDGGSTMSKDDVNKLPCFDYISNGSVDCAVCLDNFKIGDKCRLLQICNHSFHAQCVDAWLLKKPICPICRAAADSTNQPGDKWRIQS